MAEINFFSLLIASVVDTAASAAPSISFQKGERETYETFWITFN